MNSNRFVLHKLQSLLQISAALSRKIAAAAHTLPQRRFRPLFPLYAAARAEAAADKTAQLSGSTGHFGGSTCKICKTCEICDRRKSFKANHCNKKV